MSEENDRLAQAFARRNAGMMNDPDLAQAAVLLDNFYTRAGVPANASVQATETAIRTAATGGHGGYYSQVLRAAEAVRRIDRRMFDAQFGSPEAYADAVVSDGGQPWVGKPSGSQR